MGGRDGSRLVYESPLVVRVLEARVEPVARALAGLEDGDLWPSNEVLGGGPTGTRDDEYRAAMLDQAREILFADMGERFDPSTLGEPDILGVAVGELWQANGSDRRMDATPREVLSLSETHATLQGERRSTRVRLVNLGGKWRTIGGYMKVRDAPEVMRVRER